MLSCNCHLVANQSRITLHQATCFQPKPHDVALSARGEEPKVVFPLRYMGPQFMKDVLLHEMQHQAQADLGLRKFGEDAHNCRSWSTYATTPPSIWDYRRRVFLIVRRKTKSEEGKKRTNVWVPLNANEAPAGARIATQTETKCFRITLRVMGAADARYGS